LKSTVHYAILQIKPESGIRKWSNI